MAARRAAAARAEAGGLIAAPLAPRLKPVALLVAATALLYGLANALRVAPCAAVFAIVALVAWPIWRYRREFALFERRAILAGVLRDGSRVRRFFWSGHVAVALQGLASLAWAAALLALTAAMGPWHWGVLLADALLVALLAPLVARRLATDVREAQVGLAARRWVLRWINLAVLAVAFFCVDYFVAGAPDTRGLGWGEVADRAFASGSGAVACAATAAVLGAVATVDALAWHAAQVIIPTLADQGLRFAAWAVFLLQAGVVAVAATRLQLGVLAEADRRTHDAGSLRAFVAALVLALAAIGAVAWLARGIDRGAIAGAATRLVDAANPCRADASAVAALRARLDGELAKVRAAEHARAGEEIDAALAALFAPARNGVDAYLDWYFSIFGEYQRLLSRELPALMDRKLREHVFGEGFDARIESASRAIADASAERLGEATGALGGVIATGATSHPCLPERIDLQALPAIERDALRVSAAVAGGAAVALTVRAVARGAAAAAAGRAAAKPVYRGAASLGGRVVGKRGAAAMTGGLTGAACGPGAPICALLLGAAAWISLDKALVMIDEARLRPEMRRELLESLDEQQRDLAAQLRAAHGASIDRAIDAANRSLDRVFIPARS